MKTLTKDCAAAVLEAIPAVMRVIRQQMRSHRLVGLSVPQLRVLAFLDGGGPATLSDVAEHVGTTLPSMSRMIQSLVEGRLIRRRAGAPDRRTIRLEIAAASTPARARQTSPGCVHRASSGTHPARAARGVF